MDSIYVLNKKTLKYIKSYNTFIYLGHIASFEEILEFYQLKQIFCYKYYKYVLLGLAAMLNSYSILTHYIYKFASHMKLCFFP